MVKKAFTELGEYKHDINIVADPCILSGRQPCPSDCLGRAGTRFGHTDEFIAHHNPLCGIPGRQYSLGAAGRITCVP